MKKLILLVPFVLMACGESKEEKQERLNAIWKHNTDSIKAAGNQKIDSLDRLIKIEKAKS